MIKPLSWIWVFQTTAVLLPGAFTNPSEALGATLVVAASDSLQNSKAEADYVCDGIGDQEEINAAIGALPEVGGTVLLTEGNFDIRRIEVDPGGKCTCAIDIRGFGTTVTRNVMHTSDPDKPLTIRVGGGNTLITNNVLENIVIEVEDKTRLNKPIVIQGTFWKTRRSS